MNSLFLIPARGGSKGLPGKNIKLLNGKPMILYTIEAAREVGEDSDICVSTDEVMIIEVAESCGLKVEFKRPDYLSTDYATTENVIQHTIQFYEGIGKTYDFLVLLQPTSPLRNGQNIKDALKLINLETEMIVSVKETDANPYYLLFEENENGVLINSKSGNFDRRQDCPKVYELNGAIYIINIEKFKKKGLAGLQKEKFVMDKLRSIDIDDIIDFKFADFLLKENSNFFL